MRLLFRQRLFSWFDSYDIYDEAGAVVYVVKGQLSWGHCLKIFDVNGNEIGIVKERVLTFLPKFEIYLGDQYLGCICREFTFLKPKYHIACNGWRVEGNFPGWDYEIINADGQVIAAVWKEVLHWADTYVLDVQDPRDALCVLMFVLAVDAEKCSRG